jgi:homoserine O-acetyltransferase
MQCQNGFRGKFSLFMGIFFLTLNTALPQSPALLTSKKIFRTDFYKTISGTLLSPIELGYETWGTYSPGKKTILITHFFSGNSHAAGKYTEADAKPGYWDAIIGPGKAIDTDRFFVISIDSPINISALHPKVITIGPLSLNPQTGKIWGAQFPRLTLEDFVHLQKHLLEQLGVYKLHAVVGASGGAAQAWVWSTLYPQNVEHIVGVIPPGLFMPQYVKAMLETWGMPIRLDPLWKKGNYDLEYRPTEGLKESLKLIQLNAASFLWAEDLAKTKGDFLAAWNHLGQERSQFVDANSLIKMTEAIATFDVRSSQSLIQAKILLIPSTSDFIFPPELAREAQKELCRLGKKVAYQEIKSDAGHLAGLSEVQNVGPVIKNFLEKSQASWCR